MSLTRQETLELARSKRLIASHTERARLELRRAAHYAQWQPGSLSAISGHAKVAGEYAAYAELDVGAFVDHPAMATPLIREEFEASLHYTRTLLESPDPER